MTRTIADPAHPIETERLRLRPPTRDDARAIFETWACDERVTRYVVWSVHRSLADTEDFLDFAERAWADGSELTWLMCLKDGGAPVGTFALNIDGGLGGLGYVIARPYWGQGLACEAGRAVMGLGFGALGLQRIGAYCDVENTASARVMEKLGMTREGLRRACLVFPAMGTAPRDCLRYSVARDDWPPAPSGVSGLRRGEG